MIKDNSPELQTIKLEKAIETIVKAVKMHEEVLAKLTEIIYSQQEKIADLSNKSYSFGTELRSKDIQELRRRFNVLLGISQ